MKVLLTAFEPFDNDELNSSLEVLKALNDDDFNDEIIKLVIPVVFDQASKILIEAILKYQPKVVILLGQAKGRKEISLERVAINIDDARIKDNNGNQPIDKIICVDGENAYFSKLPLRLIEKELVNERIPCNISNTAGTFVCNHLMYSLLYYLNQNKLDTLGGFVHLPIIDGMDDKVASLPLDILIKAVKIIIKVTSDTLK